jgi:replication factor C subunit 3/5
MFTKVEVSNQKNSKVLNPNINNTNAKNKKTKNSKKIETNIKPISSFYKKINISNDNNTDAENNIDVDSDIDLDSDVDMDMDNKIYYHSDSHRDDSDNENSDDNCEKSNKMPKNIIIKPNISIMKESLIGSSRQTCCFNDKICSSDSNTNTCINMNNIDYLVENNNVSSVVSFKTSTPWVEKYRPSNFEDIVLDNLNKQLLKNIIDNNYFPNLLFYGPPGTGKTTTIINLVNVYQEKMNLKNKGLMIHLNASDERGIDIIRNQINSFVNSKSLFGDGMKFVILDEVDYMTKTAQIALRYLLNNYNNNFNVRFCLICNYISRIDESLQTEFVRMRFNQLPEHDILKFLQKININENLNIKNDILVSIQKHFMSDIRSMINYMQSNQDLIRECKIIKNDLWIKLTANFKKNTKHQDILKKINKISRDYNMEQKNIIKNYLNYIIRTYPITPEFLYNIENIMHIQDCKTEHILNYIIYKLKFFFGNNTL